jgi:hypothetical protein
MTRRRLIFGVILAITCALAPMQAGDVSRQQADSFAKKVAIIAQRGTVAPASTTAQRTVLSENELNSWFAYRGRDVIPKGITQPTVTIIGNGKVMGVATVDLDAVSKQKSSGKTLDPWNLVGGQVPVSVIGVLQTKDGRGQFELQSATVGGLPVPRPLLQELVSYYSRTADHPNGVRLDSPFDLPARIQRIDVGQGQAVVVQ